MYAFSYCDFGFSFSLVFKSERFSVQLCPFSVLGLPDLEFATCDRPFHACGRRIRKIGQRKFEKEEHERRGASESTVTLVTVDIIDLTMRWISVPTVSRSIKFHGF